MTELVAGCEAVPIHVIGPVWREDDQRAWEAGGRERVDTGDVLAGERQQRHDDAVDLQRSNDMTDRPVAQAPEPSQFPRCSLWISWPRCRSADNGGQVCRWQLYVA